jgi:glutathione peroxidase
LIKKEKMTIRQRIIKLIYPLLARQSRKKGINMRIEKNETGIMPLESFYSLAAVASNGQPIDFNEFRGKKVLVVNTASACGYTPQYDALQKLSQEYADKLTVAGFPSNDFGEQEKGNDQEIASFCKINFGVSFPLFKKSQVIRGVGQNEVFSWLSDKNKNGWNSQQPEWNFCKYLIDEKGVLLGYWSAGIQPFDSEILDIINGTS